MNYDLLVANRLIRLINVGSRLFRVSRELCLISQACNKLFCVGIKVLMMKRRRVH